ncbi:DUF5627 domain-containing protein [Pedobacter sp.]|uniref:DUF5627 domain-containing protein n=1 Tax=Pedobacter sp. TaxID=1411316 RepID=UPI0031E345C2
MKIRNIYIVSALFASLFGSCKNGDAVFPDYGVKTVYFANQYPLRTVVLGESPFVDNTLDNQRKVSIKATVGGVYDNNEDILIDVTVDETLLNGLKYSDNSAQVLPMPSQYYRLLSNQIKIPKGSILGGVDVQLTDDFFADPKAISRNYVIPLVMTKVVGANGILAGTPSVANPSRVVPSNWSVRPKDYVLYAIKYVNPWHANYLRKGVDDIVNNGVASKVTRHAQYVENNQVVSITATSLTNSYLPLTIKNNAGNNVAYNVVFNFTDATNCTLSSNTANVEIIGSGKFVSNGEKNSIGGTDRSAIYLNYTVDFKTLNIKYTTTDTLIVRDRNIAPQYFDVIK